VRVSEPKETLAAWLSADPALRLPAKAFVAKVSTFAYMPRDRAAAERLRPFASDRALVAAMREALQSLGDQGNALPWSIPFWSMVACVVQEASSESVQFLGNFARQLVSSRRIAAAWRLWRYLAAFDDIVALAEVRDLVHSFFVSDVTLTASSVQWAAALGIARPVPPAAWSVSLSWTDHSMAIGTWALDPDSLVVRLEVQYPPILPDDSSWIVRVKQKSAGGTLGSFYEHGAEPALLFRSGWYEPVEEPTLEDFPAFLHQVEAFYGVRLRARPGLDFQAVGLRKKDLERKLLDWARPPVAV
jgi:hypothetical protein